MAKRKASVVDNDPYRKSQRARGKVDRALSAAQGVIGSEMCTMDAHEKDRKLGDEIWASIESFRHRLQARRG